MDSVFTEITEETDGLYFWAGGQKSKMHFTSNIDFMNIEFPSVKTFVVDKSGAVEGFTKRVDSTFYPPAKKVPGIRTANVKKGQYSEFGWHLLENKRFDEAIQLMQIGKVKDPSDIATGRNLAHCYLFKNEYVKAIEIYQTFSSKEEKATLRDELLYFEKQGFDKQIIAKAIKELNLL